MDQGDRPGLPAEVTRLVSAKFFDDEECTRWWLDRCYPSGPQCPDCGVAITGERTCQSFRNLTRFTCPSCGVRLRSTKGTILEGSHLTPRELFLLCMLLGHDISGGQIANIMQLSIETVTSWRDRLTALAEVGQ